MLVSHLACVCLFAIPHACFMTRFNAQKYIKQYSQQLSNLHETVFYGARYLIEVSLYFIDAFWELYVKFSIRHWIATELTLVRADWIWLEIIKSSTVLCFHGMPLSLSMWRVFTLKCFELITFLRLFISFKFSCDSINLQLIEGLINLFHEKRRNETL